VGPAIAVMPDHAFYGRVKLEDVDEILDALERGTLVDRLVVPDAMFDDPGVPKKAKGA
jgi:(2Fe-2S) ferredoxin